MVSKAKWKKHGVNVSKYTAAEMAKYNEEATRLLGFMKRSNASKLLADAKKITVRKTVRGVKYYTFWDYDVPAPIRTAMLAMASAEYKRLAPERKHAAEMEAIQKKFTAAQRKKKTGRVPVKAYTRKPTVKAHTRKRSSNKRKR